MSGGSSNIWAIVLAGGSGRRLAAVTGGLSKQFWRLDSGLTLLESTLERIAPLVPPARTVVVVDRTHRAHVDGSRSARRTRFVYQPGNRGTAVGVLFGLMPAVDSGIDPIVLLTPSDHGVIDVEAFCTAVRDAVVWVEVQPGRIVLFGAEPLGPDGDYGWIDRRAGGHDDVAAGFHAVASFVEKPPLERAAALLAGGAVWNSMVAIARASTLLDLYARHLPVVSAVFGDAVRLPKATRDAYLEHEYGTLPSMDFSRDVLTPARNLWVYVWPASLGWSDLGTPERLRQWIATTGRMQYAAGPVNARGCHGRSNGTRSELEVTP